MVGVVEYDPCGMHVQQTVQEAHLSCTRCEFTAGGLPYLLDQCGCCVEACLVAMHSDTSTQQTDLVTMFLWLLYLLGSFGDQTE